MALFSRFHLSCSQLWSSFFSSQLFMWPTNNHWYRIYTSKKATTWLWSMLNPTTGSPLGQGPTFNSPIGQSLSDGPTYNPYYSKKVTHLAMHKYSTWLTQCRQAVKPCSNISPVCNKPGCDGPTIYAYMNTFIFLTLLPAMGWRPNSDRNLSMVEICKWLFSPKAAYSPYVSSLRTRVLKGMAPENFHQVKPRESHLAPQHATKHY